MKIKKTIYIVIITFIIYFISSYVYKKVILNVDSYEKIYILSNDVIRGQKISTDNIKAIEVSKSTLNTTSNDAEFITNLNINEFIQNGYVYKENLNSNKIICSNDLLLNYEQENNNLERISIKIKDSDSFLSYQVSKGCVVNIYYVGKLEQSKNMLDTNGYQTILSSKENDTYVSCLLLKEIKIIDAFDKSGNVIDYNKEKSQENILDTILIEVSTNEANMIANLKQYGDFSLSLKY